MPKKPGCIKCRHPGYWRVRAQDGRPRFVCDRCGTDWTCGLSGGDYVGHEMNLKSSVPEKVLREHNFEPIEADEEAREKFSRLLDSLPKPKPSRRPSTIEKRRKKRGIPDPKLDAGMRRCDL